MSHVLDNGLQMKPFSVETLIENIIYHETGGGNSEDSDPLVMESLFISTISALKFRLENVRRRREELEKETAAQRKELMKLCSGNNEQNNTCLAELTDLDERINFVATKVNHMSHQLNTRSSPRNALAKVRAAGQFMLHLKERNNIDDTSGGNQGSAIVDDIGNPFDDPIDKLRPLACDYNIRQAVHDREKQITAEFLARFNEATRTKDAVTMSRSLASLSSENKDRAEQMFVQYYVEMVQTLEDIENVIAKAHEIALSAFGPGATVDGLMDRLVGRLYNEIIAHRCRNCLETAKRFIPSDDDNEGLVDFVKLYTRCLDLRESLKQKLTQRRLDEITSVVFDHSRLNAYADIEVRWLEYRLKADLTNEGSQEVAASIIDSAKQSVKRLEQITTLDRTTLLAVANSGITTCFDKLVTFITSNLLLPRATNNRNWDVLSDTNNVFQMLERYLFIQAPIQMKFYVVTSSIEKKMEACSAQLEEILSANIDRLLDILIQRIRVVLSEQKKIDYRRGYASDEASAKTGDMRSLDD
ncbi:hypothetical protein ACOME3_004609 [Neoechinorhynchus agilis]